MIQRIDTIITLDYLERTRNQRAKFDILYAMERFGKLGLQSYSMVHFHTETDRSDYPEEIINAIQDATKFQKNVHFVIDQFINTKGGEQSRTIIMVSEGRKEYIDYICQGVNQKSNGGF